MVITYLWLVGWNLISIWMRGSRCEIKPTEWEICMNNSVSLCFFLRLKLKRIRCLHNTTWRSCIVVFILYCMQHLLMLFVDRYASIIVFGRVVLFLFLYLVLLSKYHPLICLCRKPQSRRWICKHQKSFLLN